MEELKQKWDLILQTLKDEYDIQDISFKTWIKPIKIYSLEGNKITLLASKESMGVSYIEKKYLTPLTVTICEIMGREYEVVLTSAKEQEAAEFDRKKKEISNSAAKNQMVNLNPNYTFDTFVIGNNNNLAHAASRQSLKRRDRFIILCLYTEGLVWVKRI